MEVWKRNLIILGMAQFMVQMGMSLILPFLPLFLEQDLGVQNDQNLNLWAGLIFGANFLTALIFAPIWGKLADRIGRKVMLLRSAFGMALITGLMGFVTSPIQLLGLRLLNGVISGFIPAAIALVSTNTPKERAGFALGVLQSGGVAGTILGPAFGGVLADLIGFRLVFIVTGSLLFLAGFVALVMVREINKPNPKVKATGGFIQDWKKIVASGPMLSLFVTSLMIQFAVMGTAPLLSTYVKEILGDPTNVAFFAGVVVSATGLANMFASPFLGRLGDRFGSQHVLMYCLLGAAIITLPIALANSIWLLILLRFLLGLVIGGLSPSINALIRHFAPKGMESRTYGYSTSAAFVGNMLGPITCAFIADSIQIEAAFIFTSILLFINFVWVRRVVRVKMHELSMDNT